MSLGAISLVVDVSCDSCGGNHVVTIANFQLDQKKIATELRRQLGPGWVEYDGARHACPHCAAQYEQIQGAAP